MRVVAGGDGSTEAVVVGVGVLCRSQYRTVGDADRNVEFRAWLKSDRKTYRF